MPHVMEIKIIIFSWTCFLDNFPEDQTPVYNNRLLCAPCLAIVSVQSNILSPGLRIPKDVFLCAKVLRQESMMVLYRLLWSAGYDTSYHHTSPSYFILVGYYLPWLHITCPGPAKGSNKNKRGRLKCNNKLSIINF